MDIEDLIGAAVPRTGAKAQGGKKLPHELNASVVRSLSEDDLPMLLSPPPMGSSVPSIGELRTRHHQLARCLAEGHSQEDASLITGYSPAWISTIKGDPAFRQLMNYYETQKEAVFIDVLERRRTVGVAALDEIQSRLDSEPEKWSNGELMTLAETSLGKAGTGGEAPQRASAEGLVINFVQAGPKELPPKRGVVIEG